MNNVSITGRLTKDPEIRHTSGNNPTTVATMTVAVEREYKKEGQPDADFPRVVVMGKSAENFVSKYVKKGSCVEVIGSIRTGSYQNRDGATVYTTEVFANHIGFAPQTGKNGGNAQNSDTKQEPEVPEGFSSIQEDDIPF